jgi:glycerol-3-phosphate cytidylyltransferase
MINQRVLTIGTFDLLHPGHVAFLRQASWLGQLTVAVNRDEFVQRFKGTSPIMCLEERMTMLRAIRYVDQVVVNEGDERGGQTIQKLAPSLLAIGSDWAKRDYMAQLNIDIGWLECQHIGLVYLPYTYGVSTSQIKRRLGVTC